MNLPPSLTLPWLQAIYLTAATASYTQLRELLQHHLPRLAGENGGGGQVWDGLEGRSDAGLHLPQVKGGEGQGGACAGGRHSAAVAHLPRSPSNKSQIKQNPDFAATPQLRRPPQKGHSPGNKDNRKMVVRGERRCCVALIRSRWAAFEMPISVLRISPFV